MSATSKGGYDCEFIAAPPKDLECTICLLVVREPHVITCCGNHFCRPCIERVQRDKKPCPLCNESEYEIFIHKKVMREVNALLVRCPQKALGCAWEGELGHLDQHLEIRPGAGLLAEGACGYVEVECSNGCGARFLRREQQDHEMRRCLNRPLELVMASIVKRLDTLTVENQAMKAENQQLKAELAANKESIAQLLHRVETLTPNSEVVKPKDGSVEAGNQSPSIENIEAADFAAMKELTIKLYRDIDAKYIRLDNRLTPLPPFYFTLSNYEHLRKADFEWRSEPFYTHPNGYKMQAQVFPNGFQGTHLALYVAIMRGESDDKLQWPFNGRVTVQAFNRDTREWANTCIIAFSDSAALCYRNKPKEDSISNGGWGYSNYIEHCDVTKSYATVNIIRFRVLKVEL